MSEAWKDYLKPDEAARLAELADLSLKAREGSKERIRIIDRCRKRAEKDRAGG